MATGSRRGGASGTKRSGAYRSSSRKKSTGRAGKKKQSSYGVMDEVILLAILGVSVLLFLSDLKLGGSLGKTVSGVMFGIFGIVSFAVPFIIFFAGAFIISNRGTGVAGARVGAYIALVLSLCSFAHMIFMGKYSEASAKDFYFICSEERAGGGILGALIAGTLTKFIGKAGACIFLIVILLICIVIISEKSILRYLKSGSERFYQKSLEGAKKHHEIRAVRQEESRNEREIKSRERAVRREELREERLQAIREREEALSERKRRRSEMKVTGVMMNTRMTDQSADKDLIDVEKEVAAYAEPETVKELSQELSEEVTEAAHSEEGFDDIHEVSVEDIRSIEDIRDLRRAESTKSYQKLELGERDAVNFKSVHHITFEPESAQEKIVPIRREQESPETELTFNEDVGFSPRTQPSARPDPFMSPEEPLKRAEAFAGSEPDMAAKPFAGSEAFAEPGAFIEAAPMEEIPSAAGSEGSVYSEENIPGLEDMMVSEPDGIDESIDGDGGVKTVEYEPPEISLLDLPQGGKRGDSMDELRMTANRLKEILATFGVNVTMTDISQGPTVTRFEMQPETGVKVSKILSLSDDIKLNMAATDVRIEAPIPGKAAIGIEIPNKEPIPVNFRELVSDDAFKNATSNVTFAVGKDIEGRVVVTDIAKMPHLLIAGATGSGKSVCINTLIMSILYKARPEDVKLIMIDPKVVELSVYNGIPHLMIPVVTDPKKASAALQWGVAEMDDRYNKFAEYKVRDMKGYNKLVSSPDFQDIPEAERPKKMPQIVIIVDELADLMMVASKEVEESICRIAQKARAAGIHLVVATQRPSVDVITGLIKANMPSRIAFSVSSGTDSRTILDMVGAEKLLGKGDMLFYPQGYSKPARLQGAFVSDDEVTRVVDALKAQTDGEDYDNEVINRMNSVSSEGSQAGAMGLSSGNENNGNDDLFEKAARIIIEKDKASIGMLQRAFKIGFNRAARIMDQLAEAGVVGEEEGTKPRKILMSMEQFEQYVEETL